MGNYVPSVFTAAKEAQPKEGGREEGRKEGREGGREGG
jgi:hypothetical protein